ncbi:MAG: hypothetical protein K4571_00915 [Deltaproteobacteria bacterium]
MIDQQQMIEEMTGFNHPFLNNAFSSVSAIPDPSAEIFAAVIHNTDWLPDDDETAADTPVSAPRNRPGRPPGARMSDQAKRKLAVHAQALLQERHALWLR